MVWCSICVVFVEMLCFTEKFDKLSWCFWAIGCNHATRPRTLIRLFDGSNDRNDAEQMLKFFVLLLLLLSTFSKQMGTYDKAFTLRSAVMLHYSISFHFILITTIEFLWRDAFQVRIFVKWTTFHVPFLLPIQLHIHAYINACNKWRGCHTVASRSLYLYLYEFVLMIFNEWIS